MHVNPTLPMACPNCGSPKPNPSRSYCGRVCSNKSRAASRLSRTCEHCGAAFSVLASKLRSASARYCSKPCKWAAQPKPIERTCLTCGTTFVRRPSEVGTATKRGDFCSHKCRPAHPNPKAVEIARSMGLANIGLRRHLKPPIELVCVQCRAAFTLIGHARQEVTRNNRRYCSTACWYEWLREHRELHPGFRGGRPSYPDYGPRWVQEAKAARERDGHTCFDCGLHRKRPLLDVHHRVPLRKFDGNFELANDLGNLVTLCRPCHMKWEQALVALYAPWV